MKEKKGQRQKALDEIGIDVVCAKIGDLQSLTDIAKDCGVSIGTLQTWIDKDPERSARAREVRTATAKHWDERAERGIESATDPFSLSRAKELAHHYRWRASKIAPKEYGDKVQQEITGADGGPLVVQVVKFGE